VEDEALVREDITSYLRHRGCTVREAESAEQAVAICRSGLRVDILFTDINLNGTADGWKLARLFRAAYPAVGVLYTSGNSFDQSACVPGSMFFQKPYTSSKILAACRHLQKCRLIRPL
jgi:CheY-like chemotaxis protein